MNKKELILESNKELKKYLEKHGNETISIAHFLFINGLLKGCASGYGVMYKLSNYIFITIKNKESKTLSDVIQEYINK